MQESSKPRWLDHRDSMERVVASLLERYQDRIAVLGDRELSNGLIEVTDVAADFKGAVVRNEMLDVLVDAYQARSRVCDWQEV